jgi:hypothetical protein
MIRIASQETRAKNILCETISRDEVSTCGAGAAPAFVEPMTVISRHRG